VCPWNLHAAVANPRQSAWLPRVTFDNPTIANLWRTPDAELRVSLKGSAMTRAGVKRLRRNIAVCAGATGNEDALAALEDVHEPSCDEPLVAEHVAWALRRSERLSVAPSSVEGRQARGTPFKQVQGRARLTGDEPQHG
jgi:epoxyqueuosine reductase QueG